MGCGIQDPEIEARLEEKMESDSKKVCCSNCAWLRHYGEWEEKWSEGDLSDIEEYVEGYYCELQGIPEEEYLMDDKEIEKEIKCKDFQEDLHKFDQEDQDRIYDFYPNLKNGPKKKIIRFFKRIWNRFLNQFHKKQYDLCRGPIDSDCQFAEIKHGHVICNDPAVYTDNIRECDLYGNDYENEGEFEGEDY